MIGFFFRNQHSKSFNVVSMEDAHRPLLPELRENRYTINGRHGTVSFGGETYTTRQITVDIAFISDNIANLQNLSRDIALWLTGEGLLYFDDEPTKAYDAKVYQKIDTEQLIRFKRASIVFECQPFAKSIHFLQEVQNGVRNGHTMSIESHGTQPTPPIIAITNTGTTNMSNIRITRRALNR